jgi:hypothetical protein
MEDGMAIRLDEALRWALVRTRAQADCFRHPGQFRAESRGRQEWFVTRLCGAAAHQIRNCREGKSQDRPEVLLRRFLAANTLHPVHIHHVIIAARTPPRETLLPESAFRRQIPPDLLRGRNQRQRIGPQIVNPLYRLGVRCELLVRLHLSNHCTYDRVQFSLYSLWILIGIGPAQALHQARFPFFFACLFAFLRLQVRVPIKRPQCSPHLFNRGVHRFFRTLHPVKLRAVIFGAIDSPAQRTSRNQIQRCVLIAKANVVHDNQQQASQGPCLCC